MRDKYLKGVFGTCPRVLCDSTGLRWILDGEQCAVAVYPSSRCLAVTQRGLTLRFRVFVEPSRNFCDIFLTFYGETAAQQQHPTAGPRFPSPVSVKTSLDA